MQQFHADGSAFARAMVRLTLVGAWCLGVSELALAADYKISAQTAKYECSARNPGDTLTIPSGSRGPLTITGCKGTSTNPIIIRNDPDGNGPAIVQRTGGSGGGFVLACNNCVDVEIDGSYKWRGAPSGKTYGIKVTMTGGQGPSAFLRMGGHSRNFTIRNVEVDGAWPRLASNGSGIRVNDHTVLRSKNPGLWREDILIEDNFVHDVKSEGMYIGPNYQDGDIPLRDIEIRYNVVEDTGWDGINAKSMWDGNNSIHHNVVRRAGKNGESSKSSQYSGIKNTSGTVKIYNNWIETTGQHGIVSWTQEGPKSSEGKGPFIAHVWNNVIVDAGGLWRSFMAKSYGISVGAQDGCEKPAPNIYHNTIVDPHHGAISVTSNTGAGLIRDNIAAGSGGNPVIVAPGSVKLLNNRVGPVSQMEFVDPSRRKYRLKISSPARNEGSSDFPAVDFDDVKRPRDGAPDQGAYEGSD
jgi:hypothetical protein